MKQGLWERIVAKLKTVGEMVVFMEDNRDDLHELRLRKIEEDIAALKASASRGSVSAAPSTGYGTVAEDRSIAPAPESNAYSAALENGNASEKKHDAKG